MLTEQSPWGTALEETAQTSLVHYAGTDHSYSEIQPRRS